MDKACMTLESDKNSKGTSQKHAAFMEDLGNNPGDEPGRGLPGCLGQWHGLRNGPGLRQEAAGVLQPSLVRSILDGSYSWSGFQSQQARKQLGASRAPHWWLRCPSPTPRN